MPIKVCILAQTVWAFGRIFSLLKDELESAKYKQRYLIDRYDIWNNKPSRETVLSYDLIYTCDFVCVSIACHHYHIPREKVIWGPHCVSGFWVSDPYTCGRTLTSKEQLENVETKRFPDKLLEWLKAEAHPVGCVSGQLMTIMRFNGFDRVMRTRCGASDAIVDSYKMRLDPIHARVKVMLQNPPVKVDYIHGYDVKRMGWVKQLIDSLQGVVDFVWPDHEMSLTDLDLWYDHQRGDVCLCMSHTEGNPLGLIEGIARGLVPISTNCGVAPEIIIDNVNGFLVTDIDENIIIKKMEIVLRKLAADRELLRCMKQNAWNTAHHDWRVSKTAQEWASFFEACMDVPDLSSMKV